MAKHKRKNKHILHISIVLITIAILIILFTSYNKISNTMTNVCDNSKEPSNTSIFYNNVYVDLMTPTPGQKPALYPYMFNAITRPCNMSDTLKPLNFSQMGRDEKDAVLIEQYFFNHTLQIYSNNHSSYCMIPFNISCSTDLSHSNFIKYKTINQRDIYSIFISDEQLNPGVINITVYAVCNPKMNDNMIISDNEAQIENYVNYYTSCSQKDICTNSSECSNKDFCDSGLCKPLDCNNLTNINNFTLINNNNWVIQNHTCVKTECQKNSDCLQKYDDCSGKPQIVEGNCNGNYKCDYISYAQNNCDFSYFKNNWLLLTISGISILFGFILLIAYLMKNRKKR